MWYVDNVAEGVTFGYPLHTELKGNTGVGDKKIRDLAAQPLREKQACWGMNLKIKLDHKVVLDFLVGQEH